MIEALATQKLGEKERSRELAEKARISLSSLEQKWGSDSYQRYLSRRDVTELRKKSPASQG